MQAMSTSMLNNKPAIVLSICSVFLAVSASGQNPPSAPDISISVNGSAQPEVVRGWPLIVRGVVQHSQQFANDATPIDLSHGDGGWWSAVQLNVVDSQGQPTNWNLQATPVSDSTLHLDGSHIGTILWRIVPEDTAQIPLGTYQLTAVLDNTDMPTQGWQGSITSLEVSITIKDPPATLSATDDTWKSQLFANYYALSGDVPKALAVLDDLFSRQPDQIGALTLRGVFLESQGNNDDALAAYEHAVSAFQSQFPNSPEPPKALLRQLSLLRTKLQMP
jgi:hypothetical protein